MSALAKYALFKGAIVSGSDANDSPVLKELAKCCKVVVGEDPSLVDGVDAVVYTSAISMQNPTLARAKSLGIPTFERRQFLSLVSKDFSKTVAVGGTHGKTTVTAMLIHVLKDVNADFSAHVGGETEFGNFVHNGNQLFVTEACEYKGSFLDLNPYMSVVLNAELDHPDCYKNMDELALVFWKFLQKAQVRVVATEVLNIWQSGHICINENEKTMLSWLGDVEKLCKISNGQKGVMVFSNDNVDIWTCQHIDSDCNGKKCSHMEIYKNGTNMGVVRLLDSPHSQQNTLAVTAILDHFGISVEQVDNSLSTFKGVKRRNEVVGSFRGAKVVFDYAHHPTQIEGILSTYNNKNLVVFQPHTYSRTKAYFDDFVTALVGADTLIVVDTYGARESACDGVESVELAKEISTKFASTKVYHAKTHRETIDLVNKVCFGFDNLLFLGAGDIYELKDKLDYDKQG